MVCGQVRGLFLCAILGMSGAVWSEIPPELDAACTSRGGFCTQKGRRCVGKILDHVCPSTTFNDRSCCVPNIPVEDETCVLMGGICQERSLYCGGQIRYDEGLCGGSPDRRCCAPVDVLPVNPPPSVGCGAITLVSRADWGARAPKTTSFMRKPVSLIFVHHTAGRTCTDLPTCSAAVREIQNYHMNTRDYDDIGYSFLIGGDGRIYEGRGWDRVGAHTQGYNDKSYGIAFIGDFTNVSPQAALLQAGHMLIACGGQQGKILESYRMYGHRQAQGAATECPGNELYNMIKHDPSYGSGVPETYLGPRYSRYADGDEEDEALMGSHAPRVLGAGLSLAFAFCGAIAVVFF